jgi:hypothetical protein
MYRLILLKTSLPCFCSGVTVEPSLLEPFGRILAEIRLEVSGKTLGWVLEQAIVTFY